MSLLPPIKPRLNLRRERERRGWSRAELSRRTGINAATIGIIESGRYKPYPGQTSKIAQELGIADREWLMAQEE